VYLPLKKRISHTRNRQATVDDFNPFMGRANNVTAKVSLSRKSIMGHFWSNLVEN